MAASPYGPWETWNCLRALATWRMRAGTTVKVAVQPCACPEQHMHASPGKTALILPQQPFAGVNQALEGPGLWIFLFIV